MMAYIVELFVILVILLIHWFLTKTERYWKQRGLVCYRTHNPYKLIYLVVRNKLPFVDLLIDQYKAFPERKCYPVYDLITPTLLVRDPELIRIITIKDFDHYVDHPTLGFDERVDPLWGKTLLLLKGKRWHDMRTTLSPVYTANKMRGMFNLMIDCCEQFVAHFSKTYKEKNLNGKLLVVEMKDATTKFTNDVIATTAFGIKIDSFKNPTNEFFEIGQSLKNLSIFKFLFVACFPKLSALLGLKLMPSKVYTFFRNIIMETLEIRKNNNTVRPDMIHLLMEAKKELENNNSSSKTVLTLDDIIAQCFVFFIAGFETTSSLVCFALYELTLNPDIQIKLQNEIDRTWNTCNGKLTYDDLLQMKYLDMVVSETLRKWPSNINLDRVCVKEHILKFDNEEILIEPGINIEVPTIAIHRDEQYFPNPEKFDPERFNDDNKNLIKPFTYIPFGTGPRICIGSRFALMEAKLLILYVLKHFQLEVIEKTEIPIVLDQHPAILGAKNGFWLGLKPRNTN